MAAAMSTELDELKTAFDKKRSEWIAAGHEGKWVVLGASQGPSFHTDYEGAVAYAAKTYGQKLCLIQQVLKQDRIENIQHVFWAGSGR